jgi:hypothetical protein
MPALLEEKQEFCESCGGCAPGLRGMVVESAQMKDQLTSLLRHALTSLAGLGTLLAARGCVAAEDAEAVNAAGASLIEVLVVVLAAIAARLLISLLGKAKNAKNGNGSGGTTLYGLGGCLLCMAVGAGSLLSTSCAEYPFSGSLTYRDPESGAKGGLVFAEGEKPKGFVTVPIYDPETGAEIGRAELIGGSSK